MKLSELLGKMARKEDLSPAEILELEQKADVIDMVDALVAGWVTPGSSIPHIRNMTAENIAIPSGEIRLGDGTPGTNFSGVRISYPALEYNGENWNLVGVSNDVMQVGLRASDGKLVFGGGDGWLDQYGLTFTNQEGFVQFLGTDGVTPMVIYADNVDGLDFDNDNGNGFLFRNILGPSDVQETTLTYDSALSGRYKLAIHGLDSGGAAITLQDGIYMYATGASGGETAIFIGSTSSTPSDAVNHATMYVKGGKFIIRYYDAGTYRYKYLDLTGTGVTWVHTTSAP